MTTRRKHKNPIRKQIYHICYSLAGRSVFGKTMPKVLSTALGGTQTEGTVFPNMDRPRPVKNIFNFFFEE